MEKKLHRIGVFDIQGEYCRVLCGKGRERFEIGNWGFPLFIPPFSFLVMELEFFLEIHDHCTQARKKMKLELRFFSFQFLIFPSCNGIGILYPSMVSERKKKKLKFELGFFSFQSPILLFLYLSEWRDLGVNLGGWGGWGADDAKTSWKMTYLTEFCRCSSSSSSEEGGEGGGL